MISNQGGFAKFYSYVSMLNWNIHQMIADCEENNISGLGWVDYFNVDELLEDLILFFL